MIILAIIAMSLVFFVVWVLLHIFIINFLELTDEEIKEYNEHVNRGAGYPVDQNLPGSHWTNPF